MLLDYKANTSRLFNSHLLVCVFVDSLQVDIKTIEQVKSTGCQLYNSVVQLVHIHLTQNRNDMTVKIIVGSPKIDIVFMGPSSSVIL